MILRVVYQTITGENNSFCTPRTLVHGVDIALIVDPAALLRQILFVVSEPVAADAGSVYVVVKAAGAPAELLCLFLCYEVGWEVPICVDVQRHIVFAGERTGFIYTALRRL